LDIESSAIKMCELAAWFVKLSKVSFSASYLCFVLTAKCSGDLDSIKILVENGVDFMVGNEDMRTVWLLLGGFAIRMQLLIAEIQKAAHLAASNGNISILDYLLLQESHMFNFCAIGFAVL
jgi:hypothetical protein